jgi:hypothetical protein
MEEEVTGASAWTTADCCSEMHARMASQRDGKLFIGEKGSVSGQNAHTQVMDDAFVPGT